MVSDLDPKATIRPIFYDCPLTQGLPLCPFSYFGPFLVLKLFGGNNFSLLNLIPSSTTSFPFLSYFLFLFAGLDGEVWTRRGVKGWVWTATLGLDHLVWDSRSSRRLVFGFLCSTIASGMSEGSWMLLV